MVKKGEKKIKFELLDERAARVALTGDFNSWDKSGISLRKDKNGMWQKEISLRPGKYQYKFIVDGQWRTDPLNKVTSHNPFGGENSVKEVI